jgi:hypothetical protein
MFNRRIIEHMNKFIYFSTESISIATLLFIGYFTKPIKRLIVVTLFLNALITWIKFEQRFISFQCRRRSIFEEVLYSVAILRTVGSFISTLCCVLRSRNHWGQRVWEHQVEREGKKIFYRSFHWLNTKV